MASILVKTSKGIVIDGDLRYKSTTPYVIEDTYENKIAAEEMETAGLIDIIVPFTAAAPAKIQGEPNIVVGEEDTDADKIVVSVQLKDFANNIVERKCLVRVWLSDVAAGALCAAPPSGGMVIGTKGAIIDTITSDLHLLIATDNTGFFDVVIEEAAAKELYFNIEYQGYITSTKIEFAV